MICELPVVGIAMEQVRGEEGLFLRLSGDLRAMMTEVLLRQDGREFAEIYHTLVRSAAIYTARQVFPEAIVVSARLRLVEPEQSAKRDGMWLPMRARKECEPKLLDKEMEK